MAKVAAGLHAIYLDETDDIVSICDRVTWATAYQQLVLVLPEGCDLLIEYLDLVRLRRTAEQLRLDIGLVTHDGRVIEQARAVGFPVFPTLEQAEKNRRGWWRGRRGRHQPTRPGAAIALSTSGHIKSLPDEADRREIYRRMTPRVTWQRWLLRYLGILLFFITVAILFVGLAYTIPGATLVLRPEIEPIQVSTQVVADPQLETTNFSGASVPGRLLVVNAEWQTEVETTGILEVPDAPARGQVVFFNLLDQPVTVPAGTQVSTSAGTRVVYQVISEVEVPGVVGGTAETDVVAVEPGPQGNVDANQVNQVDGSLGLQLEVRNVEPMTGGGSRTVAAVTEADHERLRSQVLQFLQTTALSEMEVALNEGEFLARDSLRVVEIEDETYSHFVGERTDRVALEIRAELHGTAVDAGKANDLIYLSLVEALEPGFELVPHSLRFRPGEVLGVDSQGRVSFVMIGEGVMAARLDLSEPLNMIAGQETDVALGFLNEALPLRSLPSVRIWPDWFGRMPYLPVRIQTEVDTGF